MCMMGVFEYHVWVTTTHEEESIVTLVATYTVRTRNTLKLPVLSKR